MVIDSDACSGCGSCFDACTYGMVEQGEDLISYKCDYCGGDPACVGECSAGALVFQVQDKSVLKRNALQMKQRSEPGTPREKRHLLSLAVLKVGRGDEQLAVAD